MSNARPSRSLLRPRGGNVAPVIRRNPDGARIRRHREEPLERDYSGIVPGRIAADVREQDIRSHRPDQNGDLVEWLEEGGGLDEVFKARVTKGVGCAGMVNVYQVLMNVKVRRT